MEILVTRNLGRYAPKFLAPAEGWWPSASQRARFTRTRGGEIKTNAKLKIEFKYKCNITN